MRSLPELEKKFLAQCPPALHSQLNKCHIEAWELHGTAHIWIYHQSLPNPQFKSWSGAIRQYAISLGIRNLKLALASSPTSRMKAAGKWDTARCTLLSRVAHHTMRRMGGEA